MPAPWICNAKRNNTICTIWMRLQNSAAVPLFDRLINRYRGGPSFVAACLCYLQHILSREVPTSPAGALDLADQAFGAVALVVEEASAAEGLVEISADDYSKLSSVILERASWLFSLKDAPQAALRWCDLHERLRRCCPSADTSGRAEHVAAVLLRAETLLESHLYSGIGALIAARISASMVPRCV